MAEIVKIGTVLKTDEQGFLVSESSKDKIKSPWEEAVNEVVDQYLDKFADRIHSVYIKGSVSRGTAIQGVSDIDSLALIKGNNPIDTSWFRKAEQELKERFSFSTGFDFIVVPSDEVISGKKKVTAFLIKNLSACVYGQDLTLLLPKTKVGRDSAVSTWKFEFYIKDKIKLLNDEDDSKEIKRQCKWIMKRLLRTGFELVMVKNQSFTRDLYPCYEIFSKYYPEKEKEMKEVLELAINPTENKSPILKILKTFGFWINGEIENIFETP